MAKRLAELIDHLGRAGGAVHEGVLARLVEIEAVMRVLEVDTRQPRAIRRGSALVTSVVLPEPLQPARPMMRMDAFCDRSWSAYSKNARRMTAGRFVQSG